MRNIDYAGNTFLVKAETTMVGRKIFRPRKKHAAMMRQLLDDTHLTGEETTGKRKDSGAYVQNLTSPGNDPAAEDKGDVDCSYWNLNKAKLERSLQLARALEKKAS